MGQAPTDFLAKAIATLQRLQEESAQRQEPMLSFLLDLAKTEAEDRVRQVGIDAEMRAALRDSSIVGFLTNIGGNPPKPVPGRRRKARVSGGARGPSPAA